MESLGAGSGGSSTNYELSRIQRHTTEKHTYIYLKVDKVWTNHRGIVFLLWQFIPYISGHFQGIVRTTILFVNFHRIIYTVNPPICTEICAVLRTLTDLGLLS